MGLKIGFDAKRLFNNYTGLGNYSRTLVSNLQKFFPEHEYHLFTNKLEINELTEEFTTAPYIIHQPEYFLDNVLWRTAQQSKTVNRLKLDIYHGLSHEFPYGIDIHTKTVVTFHDLIYEKLPTHFSYLDRKLYQYKYKGSAIRANRIIAISNQTKNDIIDLYDVPPNKVEVIYQSLDNAFIDLPLPSSIEVGNYFLYVGSIIRRKGLKTVIKAISLLNDTDKRPLIVIGDGDKYKDECLNLIQKLKLTKWITFKGKVNNRELSTYYDHSIALVLPSEYEGFGIPIIEALYRSRPVITTKDSSMAEAAGPGGILIDCNDPKALANAMVEIQSEKMATGLIKKGTDHVKETFTAEKTAIDMMNVYKRLINKDSI